MASSQKIIYAPQAEKDIIIKAVQFPNNSFIGNFNYPQNVPAYKDLFDLPKPPIDDSDPKPLKESGIRFTVKNGMTSLYFNFNTFCETTGLDYSTGNHVAMPQTDVVKDELIKLGLHNDRNDGNKHLSDTRLPATHPNEGTHTSQLLPEGTPADPKDSERNIQLTDMRFPSIMDTIPPIESLRDFEALMEDSEDDLNDLTRNLQRFSDVLYAQIIEDYWAKHEEAATSYADLRAKIEEIHDQVYKAHKNTDAYLRNYEKILLAFKSQHVEGLNKILTNLNIVQEDVKEDYALSTKNTLYAQNDHLAIWVESSRSMAWNVGPMLSKIENTQTIIQSDLTLLKTYTVNIKAMVTEIFCAFKGSLFSTLSGSAHIPTLMVEILSQPEGEQIKTITEKAKTEETKESEVLEQEPQVIQVVPIQSIIPTTTPITTDVITTITPKVLFTESSSRTPPTDPILNVTPRPQIDPVNTNNV
ncbi:hypothetical protein Tco_0318880 [Tanacetum coccineum]